MNKRWGKGDVRNISLLFRLAKEKMKILMMINAYIIL